MEEAFRHSLFQVATIISTTGYASANYPEWPALAIGVLFTLMFIGGCAGSTAGGMKVTRVGILFKSSIRKVKNEVSPRKVETVSIDSKPLNDSVIESVLSYFVLYMFICVICAVIYSIDGYDMFTNLTASITCLSNVGLGMTETIGPMGNFAGFSNFSKLLMAFEMIAGRLELFPILILFNPKTWRTGEVITAEELNGPREFCNTAESIAEEINREVGFRQQERYLTNGSAEIAEEYELISKL